MKEHQALFEKIKVLLKKHFKKKLQQHNDGNYLTIGESGVWVSSDEHGLAVGFGTASKHYDPDHDSLHEAVERLYYLLTKRKRIIQYLRGRHQYKNTIEIELSEDTFLEIEKAQTWLFPIWLKANEKVTFEERLIDSDKIIKDITQIENALI